MKNVKEKESRSQRTLLAITDSEHQISNGHGLPEILYRNLD